MGSVLERVVQVGAELEFCCQSLVVTAQVSREGEVGEFLCWIGISRRNLEVGEMDWVGLLCRHPACLFPVGPGMAMGWAVEGMGAHHHSVIALPA